jgi:homogentisate phytyltransferase/homogentisate geranylgeranyltransferase
MLQSFSYKALWQFSRPHTIYGTTASLLGLYALALPDGSLWSQHFPALSIALVACLCTNVYIVGLNQLIDLDIDRINKPGLPLAAGTLTLEQGRAIVLTSGMAGILLACWQIPYLLLTVGLSSLIGTAYSLPPIRLKRFPIPAALCIYSVRGWIVNLGLYAYFRAVMGAVVQITPELLALALFVSVLGLVIAVFKDIPDIEGDRQFYILTFSLQWGQQRVFWISVALLGISYLSMALLGLLWLKHANQWILMLIHLSGLVIVLGLGSKTDLQNRQAIAGYYQIIWILFYLEYLLYPFAFMG